MFEIRNIFLCTGPLSSFGWLSLFLLAAFSFIVLENRERNPALSKIYFFSALAQALFFTLSNGILAFIHSFTRHVWQIPAALANAFFSWAVGIGLTIAVVVSVAILSGERPALSFRAWISLAFLAVDLAMLVGGSLWLMLQLG